MSVYIKGIEMPMEGMLCIDIFPDGRVAGHYDCTIDWAKAIPVPPHGRLGDLDALIEAYDFVHVGPPGMARTLMAEAPTIIPADKEGET